MIHTSQMETRTYFASLFLLADFVPGCERELSYRLGAIYRGEIESSATGKGA